MWTLERNSIYTDLRLRQVFYGRFYDDLGGAGSTKRRAQMMCNTIENEDPDKLIKLALDYPECNDDFGPFLNVEVKIERAGTVNTRLYRKPQKKLLTLNAHSHHPNPVKEHTVLNMYRTAKSVSSNTENEKHSEKMVDELLINNGYERRVLERIKMTKPKTSKLKGNGTNKSMLKLPFLSDQCTARIKRAADKHKIPIRVVTTPGRKLKNILTSSKPLDKTQCPNNNCKTCAALRSGGNVQTVLLLLITI